MSVSRWHGLAAFALSLLAAAAVAGDVPRVSDAWARATAPGVDVAAVYLAIDGGATPDRVLAASTSRAAMCHLHTVEEKDGVSKMRPVDAIEVPAAKHVELVPKGTHIMLMGFDKPLAVGESFPLTLRFEKAGEQSVTVTVRPAGDDHAHH